jgi:hypothetical protein
MDNSLFTSFGRLTRLAIVGFMLFNCLHARARAAEPSAMAIMSELSGNTNEHLLAFRSEAGRNNKVVLKWRVSPSQTFSYQVEKSRDGENFTPVQTSGIQADGVNEFAWTDLYPKMINCYRLRMTDGQGATTYSKTLIVTTFPSGDAQMVGATPDMSRNDIQVSLQMRESALVSMNVTDEQGNMVIDQKEKVTTGFTERAVKGSHELKPGVYFLKVVVNGTDRMLVRLVKS